jgi:hypothetical protein
MERRPAMEDSLMKAYEAPRVTDFGSLEELTASCDAPGVGDKKFPASLTHNVIDLDSTGGVICISK